MLFCACQDTVKAGLEFPYNFVYARTKEPGSETGKFEQMISSLLRNEWVVEQHGKHCIRIVNQGLGAAMSALDIGKLAIADEQRLAATELVNILPLLVKSDFAVDSEAIMKDGPQVYIYSMSHTYTSL